MADLRQRFGQRLKRLRTAQGLSQVDLAAAASLDRVFVGGIERGAHSPSLDTLDQLSRALGVKLTKMLDMDDEKLPRSAMSDEERIARKFARLMRGRSKRQVEQLESLVRMFLKRGS